MIIVVCQLIGKKWIFYIVVIVAFGFGSARILTLWQGWIRWGCYKLLRLLFFAKVELNYYGMTVIPGLCTFGEVVATEVLEMDVTNLPSAITPLYALSFPPLF